MFPSITSNGRGFFIPQIQPRLFEELHAERSYLLSLLQQENLKATDLLRKLPPLEETLVRSQVAHARRRARKQIGWLRYRINEATRQERAILNRLGQLAQEIQSRERWNQIENEQRHPGPTFNNLGVPCYEIQQMHFTTTSPQSPLQEFPFPYMQTPRPQQYGAREFPWYKPVDGFTPEIPSEACSAFRDDCQRENFWPEAQTHVATTPNSTKPTKRSSSLVDIECMATNTPSVSLSHIKRHSTGSRGALKIWSDNAESEVECQDESSEVPQYFGYYINRQATKE